MKMTYLDNGFYMVSRADAIRLGEGELPAHGHEKLVKHDGKHWWLGRTQHQGRLVWAIRETAWRLKDGQAVLGGAT